MKLVSKLFPLLSAVLASILPVMAQQIAIHNVTVVPMTSEKTLANQTVIIEGGIIKAIGHTETLKVPEAATTVDGSGKFLMPGLFDMHVHFFHEQGEYKNTIEQELRLMLLNGVTTARIMAGHPVYLEARDNVARGRWTGPTLFVASPQFVGRWPWPPTFKNFEIVDTPEKATVAVKKFQQEGYDAIKITFMVTREVYDAIVNAAKDIGINVVGHVGPQVKLPAALRAGQQIEHMDEFIDMLLPDTTYNRGQSVSDMNIWRPNAWATVPHLDEDRIPMLVDMVAKANVYVTPTNYFFFSCFGEGMTDDAYRAKPDYQYIPEVIKQERWHIKGRYWQAAPPEASRKRYVALRKKMTYELWKAGVPLMAGSDSPEWFLVPGFSIHDELKTFVDCGLSPFEALKTATVNTAEYLGLGNTLGTVEEGKRAHLVLLNANPLDDIANTTTIEAVFKDSEVVQRKTIDQWREELLSLGK